MTTTAYHDGRMAGYYGNVKSANPYRKADWTTWERAAEWDRGYDHGSWFRTADSADLMRALNNFGNLVTS